MTGAGKAGLSLRRLMEMSRKRASNLFETD